MAAMRFDSKCELTPPTILLGLLLCPWMWGISSQPLQRLPSYWGFSDLGRGVSLHDCYSKVQPLLLTLDKVAPPDLEHGVAPLGPPAPTHPSLLVANILW